MVVFDLIGCFGFRAGVWWLVLLQICVVCGLDIAISRIACGLVLLFCLLVACGSGFGLACRFAGWSLLLVVYVD